jgi:hypothetical protein
MYPVGYPRYTATRQSPPVCSLILYNPAEFWGAIQVFDECDACLSRKKKSSHILLLTAIRWTKRRVPRLMTNSNIFVRLWCLPYAKRSTWRSDESRQIKNSILPYITWKHRILASYTCEQTDHFQEPGIHKTCYSRLFQPTIAKNMEILRTSEMTLRPLTVGSSNRVQFSKSYELFLRFIFITKLKPDNGYAEI